MVAIAAFALLVGVLNVLLVRHADAQVMGEGRRQVQNRGRVRYIVSLLQQASECTPTDKARLEISCGSGSGTVQIDDELNRLTCQNVGSGFVQCTDTDLPSFAGFETAYFEFSCIGQIGTAELEASVTLLSEDTRCFSDLLPYTQRQLQVAPVCAAAGDPYFILTNVLIDVDCFGAENVGFGLGICSSIIYQAKGSRIYPSIGLEVTSIPNDIGCIWPAVEVNDSDDLPTMQSVEYDVTLNALISNIDSSDFCNIDSSTEATVSCGIGGSIEKTGGNDDVSCARSSASTLRCAVASSRALSFLGAVESFSCVGSTTEALSIEVLWDTGKMYCQNGPFNLSSIITLMDVTQVCLIPPNDDKNHFAKDCTPVGTTVTDCLDIDSDGLCDILNDFYEVCMVYYSNCHSSGGCDSNNSQHMESFLARVPPNRVDLRCARFVSELPILGDNGNPPASSPAETAPTGSSISPATPSSSSKGTPRTTSPTPLPSTASPSNTLTPLPTNDPTGSSRTASPTHLPTISLYPTIHPTRSEYPSLRPSQSFYPSFEQSNQPNNG